MSTSALAELGRKLKARAAPPSQADLRSKLSICGGYIEFMRLVHEFVPEIEEEVRSANGVAAKMQLFAIAFEGKHFPLYPHLSEGDSEEYEELSSYIPVIVTCLDYDDYETIADGSWRYGIALAAYVLEDPYSPHQEGCHSAIYLHDSGARISIGEACAKIVSIEVLKRVPKDGISLEDAHKLLDGTRLEGLATVGDILHFNTGDPFHDNDRESVNQGGPGLEWTRENVDDITQGWLKAEDIDGKANQFYDWIEENPEQRLTELLDFIEARRKELNPKPQKIEIVGKFKPRDSDRIWLKDLVKRLSVGGTWIAPAGFIFEKVSNKEIKLIGASQDPRLHAEAMELIFRTIAVGKDAHIRVNIDDLETFLIGGAYDAQARRPLGTGGTAVVGDTFGVGDSAGPIEGQIRFL